MTTTASVSSSTGMESVVPRSTLNGNGFHFLGVSI